MSDFSPLDDRLEDLARRESMDQLSRLHDALRGLTAEKRIRDMPDFVYSVARHMIAWAASAKDNRKRSES